MPEPNQRPLPLIKRRHRQPKIWKVGQEARQTYHRSMI
jgi:hypothetical protein